MGLQMGLVCGEIVVCVNVFRRAHTPLYVYAYASERLCIRLKTFMRMLFSLSAQEFFKFSKCLIFGSLHGWCVGADGGG